MHKVLGKSLICAVFVLSALGIAAPAFAQTPILSASSQGSNNIQISISNANSNSQINLYSRQSSSLWTVVNNLGQTDGNGYFTQVISMAGDGSGNSIQLYAIVGGLQSTTVSVSPNGDSTGGCDYYGCSSSSIYFSPSSVSLAAGQSSTVSIYNNNNYNSSSYYISSNSNSSVASASVSGSSLYVSGLTTGSTNIIVCQSNYSSSCATLYVTVTGNNYGNGNIYFSPSSVSLAAGQSSTVSIYNNNYNSGSYYVSSNSNSSVATASISGSSLYVSGLIAGSTNIIVCQSSYSSSCATLYITVSGSSCGYSGCSSGNIYFSPSSVSLAAGQSSTVSVYNNYNSGSYYISSNSNSSVASASVSGSSLYVSGLTTGSTNIIVCQSGYSSSCATLYVTVTGNNYGGGSIYFSPSSVSLAAGQSSTVSVYNNNYNSGSYVLSSDSNSSVANASISGSSLYVSGLTAGSTNIMVCQSGYSSSCATLYVTVTGSVLGASTNIWFSPQSPTMYAGQSLAVSVNSGVYGSTAYSYGSTAYYVSSNSNPGVVTASLNGTVLNLYANTNGTDNISVCSSALGFCNTLYVTVGTGGNYGGTLSLSQTSITLAPGQSGNVNIYGSGSYYVSSNGSNYVANAVVSGNVLSVYASQVGNTTISVCQSGYGSCATLSVTVSGTYYNNGNGGGLQYQGGGGVLGASTYSNGSLISEGSTVYIVYKNTKSGFANSWAFTGLGFKFSNVVSVGNSGLNSSGYTVTTPYTQHPWGSWIKSGNTVYFVQESGLIPVPDWNTFLNNGGQGNLIVNANSYDFKLAVLSPMVNNDSRLQ